jgi:hypothetical protein
VKCFLPTPNPAAGSDFYKVGCNISNVTVNAEWDKACVLPVKNLELICKIGNNSSDPYAGI